MSFKDLYDNAFSQNYGKVIKLVNNNEQAELSMLGMEIQGQFIEAKKKVTKIIDINKIAIVQDDMEKTFGKNRLDKEEMYEQLQNKLQQEDFIQIAMKNRLFFHQIMKNQLIETIYPITFYYLTDVDGIPCLPRRCPKFSSSKCCQIQFSEFECSNTILLTKHSLQLLETAKYYCSKHKEYLKLWKHDMSLQHDILPSKLLLKLGETFITTDFYEWITEQFLTNKENSVH